MKGKPVLYKYLVVGVIVLFISMGIQPAVAITKDRINHPPDKPVIIGESLINNPGPYEYTFNAEDPDKDYVYYQIDWGDYVPDEWIGPYPSGEDITISHTFDYRGRAMIRARAKDIYGAVGEWGELPFSRRITNSEEECELCPSIEDVVDSNEVEKYQELLDKINSLKEGNERLYSDRPPICAILEKLLLPFIVFGEITTILYDIFEYTIPTIALLIDVMAYVMALPFLIPLSIILIFYFALDCIETPLI